MIRELLVGLLMRSPRLQKRGIRRLAQSRMQKRSQTAQELLRRDAITVVLSGTGTPIPSERAQASVAIFVNGQFLLFDCGHRAIRSMEIHDLPLGKLDAVFLTHYHSDHFADLESALRELGNHSNAKIMSDIPDYHMDVHEAGQLAHKNGIKHLALTHLVPTVTAKAQVRAFFEEPITQHYAGKLTIGDDGTRIVIALDKE